MNLTATQRRAHNLALAKSLASMGIYVFPSKDKTPMCAVWQRADTDFTPEQRSAETAKFEAKHGFPPPHVGSTIDPKIITKLWRQFEDAVPSISCGPSNLYVIDADFAVASEGKRAKNGPEKLASYLAENEIPLDGAVVIDTQSGGKHLYFKNSAALDSKAGILRDLDCDVRGIGGQTVAPGAIRVDGKHYKIALGELGDLSDLPDVPEGVISAVRTARETTEVKDAVVAASIAKLEETDIPSFADVFDPIMGYDIEALSRKDEEFAELYKNGTGDISRNRFKMARCLMREWPNMPIEHLLSFHSGWVLPNGEEAAGYFNDGSSKKGAGEYNYRDIAREHAKGVSEHKVSDGSSFSSIDDEEIGTPPPKLDKPADKKVKFNWMNNALYVPLDLSIHTLPPRPVIYGKGLLQKGEMTLLNGASGRGKSAYDNSVGLDIGCGIDHLGNGVFRKRKVLIYNAEDSQVELQRRVAAYMEFHKFTLEMRMDVHKNVILLSGKDGRITLAKSDGREVVVQTGQFKALEQLCVEHKIEVLILDPLVAMHDIPENDNTGMGAVMSELGFFTSKLQVATLIAHHDKKGLSTRATGDANADDARGAGSIISTVRTMLSVGEMRKSDAHKFGIDEDQAYRYMVVSKGAKSNYSPRDPTIKVYRLESVIADNGDGEYDPDNTVALSLHIYSEAAAISDDEILVVLSALDKPDAPVGSDPRHKNYLGKLIADACDMDWGLKRTKDSVKDIMKLLVKRQYIEPKVLPAHGKGAEARGAVSVYVRGQHRPDVYGGHFEAVDDEE